MVRWHHQLDGHEFEQALEFLIDRETWRAAVLGVKKSWTQLSKLNGPDVMIFFFFLEALTFRIMIHFELIFVTVVKGSVQLLRHVRLCDTMDCSMPGFPVHHPLLELTETHVH